MDLLDPYQAILLEEGDPPWIVLKKGINVQVKCSNPNCPSHQEDHYTDGAPQYLLLSYPEKFAGEGLFKMKWPYR